MVTGLKENLIAIGGAAAVQRLIDEYETDIRESVAAEKYRQNGKVTNRSSVKQPKPAIIMHSREGRIVAVNHNLLDILGYAPGELVAAGIDKIFMDQLDVLKLQAEMDHKGYVIDYRARLRNKDGSEVTGLITSTIRWYNDESVPGNQPLFKSWVRLSKQG
jgi:PAS domain S-box-containing protein